MFDLNAALRRLAGDHDLVQLVMRVFLDDAPTLLSRIQSSAQAADWQQVHQAAHSLRGLAANLDAKAVIDASFEVERMTGDAPQDIQGLEAHIERLAENVAATIDALKLMPRP